MVKITKAMLAFSFASICYGRTLKDNSDEKATHFENNFESLNSLLLALSEPHKDKKVMSDAIYGNDIDNGILWERTMIPTRSMSKHLLI